MKCYDHKDSECVWTPENGGDGHWICPVDGAKYLEDCPVCGFPCEEDHIQVARCKHCHYLYLTSEGDFYPNPEEKEFFCDDCYDELMPEGDI
jgi:hypothetical protein